MSIFSKAVRSAFMSSLPDFLAAYPLAADNVLRLLPCRLRGVNQPVNRTRNRFSRPRQPCWPASGHTWDAQRHDAQLPPVLRPSAPGATGEPERATPLSTTTHGPSI